MYKKIHFIGAGGISMSGLAEMALSEGHRVTGSDMNASPSTERLNAIGASIALGHRRENIMPDTDTVVYTAAVKQDNPEYIAAKEMNIRMYDRAEYIGRILERYKYPVCVSGTHGKTTTSCMISEILLHAGKDPTINIGGVLPSIGAAFRSGGSGFFVLESCEYCDSFLNFKPHVGVILNIELDHLDYFTGLPHIRRSYKKFAANIRPGGTLVINYNIAGRHEFYEGHEFKTITYGHRGADWHAGDIACDGRGMVSFDLIHKKNGFLRRVSLNMRGEYNVYNALAAIAAADALGVGFEEAVKGLAGFTGPLRRFEIKGARNGVVVADDYAHHPTEIKAMLAAARQSGYGDVWCVFQPHTYTRTKHLLHSLAESFGAADHVLVVDIFAAREKDTGEIHSAALAGLISNTGIDAAYCSSFDEAVDILSKRCIPNDLLITMGAGDVYLIGEMFLSEAYPHFPQIHPK